MTADDRRGRQCRRPLCVGRSRGQDADRRLALRHRAQCRQITTAGSASSPALVAVEELHRTGTAAAVPSRRDRVFRGGGRAVLRALYRQQRDRRPVRPRAADAARCRRPDRRRRHPQRPARSRHAFRALARRPEDLLGYLEVHIEQGRCCCSEDLPVGIVTSIAGNAALQR